MPGSEERWCGRGNNSCAVFSRHGRPERIYLYLPTPGLRGHWPTHSWSTGHKWCSVEMLRRTTLGNKTKLNKFLYRKISMSLQYRFIFIMVHCESSVDAIFFSQVYLTRRSPLLFSGTTISIWRIVYGVNDISILRKTQEAPNQLCFEEFPGLFDGYLKMNGRSNP